MPARHVIFDCDGVLVDSEALANRVLIEVLAERGLRISAAEADALFLGRTLPACLRIAERLHGAPLGDGLLEQLEHRSRIAFERELQPVEGVREVLEGLPVPASVASNSSRAGLARKLRQTGLFDFFAGRLYSFEDVARPKPFPDMYLLAAQRALVPPHECLVVEDSLTGIEAARAAGMRVLGFAPAGDGARLRAGGAEPFERMTQLGQLIAAAVRG